MSHDRTRRKQERHERNVAYKFHKKMQRRKQIRQQFHVEKPTIQEVLKAAVESNAS